MFPINVIKWFYKEMIDGKFERYFYFPLWLFVLSPIVLIVCICYYMVIVNEWIEKEENEDE